MFHEQNILNYVLSDFFGRLLFLGDISRIPHVLTVIAFYLAYLLFLQIHIQVYDDQVGTLFHLAGVRLVLTSLDG